MVNWSWIPGVPLLQQAWDATKLAGAVMQHRRERAVVLANERRTEMAKYKGKKASERMRELVEAKEYEQVVRLFVPGQLVDAAYTAKDLYFKIWDIYWIFCIVRILLVFLPQPGYLHPDEFFQSVEVVAGDAFSLDTMRTWEFNSTSPVRSMTVPMLVYGAPLYALKALNATVHYYTGWSVVTSYVLLVLPRLTLVILSFGVDYCVYQICVLYKHSYNRCLTTLSSSYVMLVYATRAFSNTIELLLFSALLYLVAHCMKRTSETVFLQKLVQTSYDEAETISEKVKINKKRKIIPEHDFKYFLPISIICAVGVFNRPTFAAFAFVPLFFWFQRGVARDSYFTPFIMFNFRIVSMLPGFLVSSLLFILFDSLYYGDLTLRKLWDLEMDWSDWKVTPLQFIMYNVVPGNLDKHGSHPFYLHALVNIMLLFGPLGMATHFSILTFFNDMFTKPWMHKPGVRTIYALALFSFLVPLCVLSLFPHQEPRFLLPLLLPAVLLSAHKLRHRMFGYRPLLWAWYSTNLLFAVFFVFFHQAGVVPAVRYFANEHVFPAHTHEASVVFSHTYMPPKFLLLQPKRRAEKTPFWTANHNVRINLVDLAGQPMTDVHERLLIQCSRAKHLAHVKTKRTYIVLPGHLVAHLSAESKGDLALEHVATLAPHLSLESLPSLDGVWEALADPSQSTVDVLFEMIRTVGEMSLAVYEVTLGDGVNTVEMGTKRASAA